MSAGVIHSVSRMLMITQMTVQVNHFMSEMRLRNTQMTMRVIHFMSEMLRGSQMIVGVIHFMSEMLRDNQVTVEFNKNAQGYSDDTGGYSFCV